MKKLTNVMLLVISVLSIFCGVGCVALSHWLAPAGVDMQGVKYVEKAGVASPGEFDGYGNLEKANRLKDQIDDAHSINVLYFKQQIEKEGLDYSILRDVQANNVNVGSQREQMLFGEKGLLSMGLSLAGFGSMTGLLGLMRKRPGDITQKELQDTVSTVTGDATLNLGKKEREIAQLVKGIHEFRKTYKGDAKVMTVLNDTCNKAQDEDTQVTVAQLVAKL